MSDYCKISPRQILDTLCVEDTHCPRVPVDGAPVKVIDFAEAARAIREASRCRPSSVTARSFDTQVAALTAKYQPVVEQRIDILCPGLKDARQAMVQSITRELVDRELFA